MEEALRELQAVVDSWSALALPQDCEGEGDLRRLADEEQAWYRRLVNAVGEVKRCWVDRSAVDVFYSVRQ